MSDHIGPYITDWIVSFRCEFKSDQQPVWIPIAEHKDDWTAKKIGRLDPKPKPSRGDDRVELSKRRNCREFKRLVLGLKDADNNRLIKHPESSFSWIPSAGQKRTAKALDDRSVCTLLNHVVAAQSTGRLTSITSTVGRHRVTEIRGLKSGQPSWFYTYESGTPVWRKLLANYVLSYPELFASRIKGELVVHSYAYIEKILRALRQKTSVSVLKYEEVSDGCILRLQLYTELCLYERGALCNCIPVPGRPVKRKTGDPKEPVGVYSPEVVISSPAVKRALSALSDIWQDKSHAILVSGPPGSGKENFALSIPYGSGFKKHDDDKRIPTISLANGLPAQQEKQILGYQQDDGSIVDGLLAKASGAAIFIDEAHYPTDNPGVRPALLRALEAKEYYPVESLKLRRADDVQWIFASSLPLDRSKNSLSRVPPDDFWTRMTHQIRIEHPLDQSEFLPRGANRFTDFKHRFRAAELQKKCVADLFKFFWWDRVKSHFDIDPVAVLAEGGSSGTDSGTSLNASDRLYRGYVRGLTDETPLSKVATLFASALMKEVGSISLAEVSIRGLRSMVSRIFSKCVGLVTSGDLSSYGVLFRLEKGETMDTAAEKNVEEDIQNVIREIQQIARLKS